LQLQEYIGELGRARLLDREEEAALWRQFKEEGSESARQILIESYQPLVFRQAMPFRKQENIMDIIQEGTVGLIEAVETYDFRKGVAFSLYAVHRIRGRMLNFMEKEGKVDIACMEEPGEGSRETLKESLADMGATVTEQAETHELIGRLRGAMERLPQKERVVLESVYLHSEPVKDVAECLQVSTSHIYRLQKSGIRRIRGMLSRFMHHWGKQR